jgi:hypothetical protein
MKKNKKLSLHTLICGNITLKTRLRPFISEKPKDYLQITDVPVKTDYNYANFGTVDGVPY